MFSGALLDLIQLCNKFFVLILLVAESFDIDGDKRCQTFPNQGFGSYAPSKIKHTGCS